MWLPSPPTAAPGALRRLWGQPALRELLHRAAPRAAGGRKGWWTLGVIPETCQAAGWAKDGRAVPGSHGSPHVVAVVDGEDPTPTAGVPQGRAFSCPCPSPRSPPAPSLPLKRSCTGRCCPPAADRRRVWALSPLPTQCEEPLSPSHRWRQTAPAPAGIAAAGCIYSSVKPPAELRPAAGSLGFAASDTAEFCPAPAVCSLPVFIPCITRFIPSPVHSQLPPAQASRGCCEGDPGRED